MLLLNIIKPFTTEEGCLRVGRHQVEAADSITASNSASNLSDASKTLQRSCSIRADIARLFMAVTKGTADVALKSILSVTQEQSVIDAATPFLDKLKPTSSVEEAEGDNVQLEEQTVQANEGSMEQRNTNQSRNRSETVHVLTGHVSACAITCFMCRYIVLYYDIP